MKRFGDGLSAIVNWCCKWPAGEFLAGLVLCGLIGAVVGLLWVFPVVPLLFGLWFLYRDLKGKR